MSTKVPRPPHAGAPPFSALSWRPSNMDMCMEAHQTLTLERDPPPDFKGPIHRQSARHRPATARANVTRFSSENRRPPAAATRHDAAPPSACTQRPMSARSHKSLPSTSAITSGTAATSVRTSRSTTTNVSLCSVRPFQTVFHSTRNHEMRLLAMKTLSLGIHREPFIYPADRCPCREEKEVTEERFRAAEAVARMRDSMPVTPRSVSQFFEDDAGFVEQDRAQWKEFCDRVHNKSGPKIASVSATPMVRLTKRLRRKSSPRRDSKAKTPMPSPPKVPKEVQPPSDPRDIHTWLHRVHGGAAGPGGSVAPTPLPPASEKTQTPAPAAPAAAVESAAPTPAPPPE